MFVPGTNAYKLWSKALFARFRLLSLPLPVRVSPPAARRRLAHTVAARGEQFEHSRFYCFGFVFPFLFLAGGKDILRHCV